MSPRAKARIVGSVLLLVAVWPVAHRQLVTRYDVNPWKLYGFAMYCTPHGIAVDLIDRSGTEPVRIEVASLPPPARADFERFEARRSTLGALHPPDELAATLFEALPGIDRLTIAVTVFSLEPFAANITPSTTLHPFERREVDLRRIRQRSSDGSADPPRALLDQEADRVEASRGAQSMKRCIRRLRSSAQRASRSVARRNPCFTSRRFGVSQTLLDDSSGRLLLADQQPCGATGLAARASGRSIDRPAHPL